MEKTILIDTNLYLDDAKVIYKMSRRYERIIIPLTVLKELDKHKFNRDLSYSARNAIQAILGFTALNKDKVVYDIDRYLDINSPDEKIIASAKKYKATIATKDVSMSIIAEANGLETTLYDDVLNNIFNPYIYLTATDLYDATEEDVFSYQGEYEEEEEYDRMLTVFSKIAGRELGDDHWWFAVIDVELENPIVYANHPLDQKIIRIDNKPQYREIVTDGDKIRARDIYQVCAMYALKEAPHVLVNGKWGSGKSLLATASAISTAKKKTFITRAPLGINSKYDIGFLPGDMEDKMMDWLQGFTSALYYLYGNTKSLTDPGGKSYDYVKDRLFHEKFQIIPMNSIQGLSLLDDDVLIVDEAQLVDVSYMSMILSRPSGTSKLILLGDLKQTYDVVKPSESGLLKLLRVLPHKYMAFVELQNSYRSPLLEVADQLQDRTII